VGTVKFVGKSEEEAVRKAAQELGIGDSEVRYKIISRAGGLLGLLGQTVTIEVSLGERGTKPEEPAPQIPDEPEESVPAAPAGDEEAEGVDEPRRAAAEPKAEPAGARQRKKKEEQVVDEEVIAQKLERAQEVITEIVRLVGGEAEVKTFRSGAEIQVSIIGKLPDWLGRGHSRAMESLQFIANKIVNRFPPRYRVILMPEGQRDERLKQLELSATELARKVSETGQSAWLVPMTAKERRIVHLAVSTVSGLGTRSVGEGNSRRLCIFKQ